MLINDTLFKPSLSIQNQLPRLDEDSFYRMMSIYYEWLQTSKLEFYIDTTIRIDETIDSGVFTQNEIINGINSKARAKVMQVGVDYIIIKMLTETPLNLREQIQGESSGALAHIFSIKDNAVRATGQFLNDRDPQKSSGIYLEHLKEELNKGIPSITAADRRLIINKFKDFYRSKSNEQAYKFIFAALYDDKAIEIRYPGEDLLRVSAGNYDKPITIRVTGNADTNKVLLNQTISGANSGALAYVTDIKSTSIETLSYSELTLSLTSGTFIADEGIKIVGSNTVYTSTYGIIAGATINAPGSGYSVGDILPVTGSGYDGKITVSEIGSGDINRVKINTTGFGYRVGTILQVNDAGTGGTGLIVSVKSISSPYSLGGYTVGKLDKIQIVNRGLDYKAIPSITAEDTTIKSIGALSENLISLTDRGSDYSVGNTLIFTGGSGANAAGIVASIGNIDNIVTEAEEYILTEASFTLINERNVTDNTTFGFDNILLEGKRGATYNLIQEESLNGIASAIKHEDWNNIGPISRIELTNFGDGYTVDDLPTIEVSSTVGYNATLVATGIQGVGAAVAVDYANNNSGLGSIRGVDIVPGLNYGVSNTLIVSSGFGAGNANLSPIISGTIVSKGIYLNDASKLGYKTLQDSYFYQDFSYVIRSSVNFASYSTLVKSILHPAGLEFFGEIVLLSLIENLFNQINTSTEILKQISSDAATINISFFQGELNGLFKDLKIFDLWYVETQAYGGLTLEDQWHTWDGPHVTKLIKAAGTVTVAGNVVQGTGTIFTGEFLDGEELIIGDESANILNVANNTYMTLNLVRVPATLSGTYTTATDIYKRRLQ